MTPAQWPTPRPDRPARVDHRQHPVPPLPVRWLRRWLSRHLFADLNSKRDRRYNR